MTMTDAALARTLAEDAGRLLCALRDRGELTGKALGDAGDAQANALILDRLRTHRPDDAILSEEAGDDRRRCAHSRVWIVDPLDGTREYAEGRADWAVHVALAIDREARVGAVAIPATATLFATDDPARPRPAIGAPPRMVVSRTRPPALALHVAQVLGAETIPMGSAGAKAMAVVAGEADIYLHDGGQFEWDNCAPAAVALAAGLHASRIDGRPLVYNCADPLLPDLLICRLELAERILAAIRAG